MIDQDRFFDYATDLSLEWSQALHVPIDVQVLNAAPLSFQHSVLHQGMILLAGDEDVLADYIERVSLDYMEFAHHSFCTARLCLAVCRP